MTLSNLKFLVFGFVLDEYVHAKLKAENLLESLEVEEKNGYIFVGEILEGFDDDSFVFFDGIRQPTKAQEDLAAKKVAKLAKVLGLDDIKPVRCFLAWLDIYKCEAILIKRVYSNFGRCCLP